MVARRRVPTVNARRSRESSDLLWLRSNVAMVSWSIASEGGGGPARCSDVFCATSDMALGKSSSSWIGYTRHAARRGGQSLLGKANSSGVGLLMSNVTAHDGLAVSKACRREGMRCLPSGNPSLRRSRAQMLLRDLLGFQGARGTEPEGWPLRLFRLPVTRRDRCDDPGEFILREGRVAPFACPEREDCANIRLTYADAEETPGQPCGCVVPHAFVGGPEQRRREPIRLRSSRVVGSDASLPPHPRGRGREPR